MKMLKSPSCLITFRTFFQKIKILSSTKLDNWNKIICHLFSSRRIFATKGRAGKGTKRVRRAGRIRCIHPVASWWSDLMKNLCVLSHDRFDLKRGLHICASLFAFIAAFILCFFYINTWYNSTAYSSHIRGLDLFYCALQCFIPWHLDFVDTWVIGEFCILCICANSQYSLVHFRFHFHLKTRTLLAAAAAAAAITTTHVKPQGTPKTNYRCRIHLTTQSSPSFCKSITNVC